MNFPIQSMIASAMSRAIAALHDYKMRMLKKHGRNMFNIVLQIHDAILFEVPYKYVKQFCEYVLPTYMRESAGIYPTDLDGMPTGGGPFLLGLEADVMDHWGEVISHEKAEKHKMPTGTGTVTGCIVNYSTAKKPRQQRSVARASKKRPARELSYPPGPKEVEASQARRHKLIARKRRKK